MAAPLLSKGRDRKTFGGLKKQIYRTPLQLFEGKDGEPERLSFRNAKL